MEAANGKGANEWQAPWRDSEEAARHRTVLEDKSVVAEEEGKGKRGEGGGREGGREKEKNGGGARGIGGRKSC